MQVRQHLSNPELSPEQQKVLKVMERTFTTHIMDNPAAVALKEELNALEAELSAARNTMALGYKDPATGEWPVCNGCVMVFMSCVARGSAGVCVFSMSGSYVDHMMRTES
jgi:hypothetical protein